MERHPPAIRTFPWRPAAQVICVPDQVSEKARASSGLTPQQQECKHRIRWVFQTCPFNGWHDPGGCVGDKDPRQQPRQSVIWSPGPVGHLNTVPLPSSCHAPHEEGAVGESAQRKEGLHISPGAQLSVPFLLLTPTPPSSVGWGEKTADFATHSP